MNLEEGDLVLCTVERIEKTVVFVKISLDGEEIEGSITMSEIAPGRIRNIRDYVVPKKKIVCKVLRVSQKGNIELSLRRVTLKEKKEVTDQDNQEKSYIKILKSVLGDKSNGIITKINKEKSIFDFFEEAKENPRDLEKVMEKNDAKKILEILNTQKQKKAIIKKEINLKIYESNGLDLIKKIFGDVKDVEVKYISAGKYSMKTESKELKEADRKLKNVAENIEKIMRNLSGEFSIIEK